MDCIGTSQVEKRYRDCIIPQSVHDCEMLHSVKENEQRIALHNNELDIFFIRISYVFPYVG